LDYGGRLSAGEHSKGRPPSRGESGHQNVGVQDYSHRGRLLEQFVAQSFALILGQAGKLDSPLSAQRLDPAAVALDEPVKRVIPAN